MSAVGTAAGLVAFPVGATVVGAGVAARRRPRPRATSAIQHLAAGVVFAAVAGEVLPDLRDQHSLATLVLGFVAGVAVLLLVDGYARRAADRAGGGTGLPIPLLITVGIDLFIDGLLVGIGAALGEGQGRILTLALTLEVLFLGLSLAIQLGERGVGTKGVLATTAVVSMFMGLGAVGGALVLADASHAVLAGVLAFGAAALLYLVTEELLVEAHEETETVVLTTMFFLGFLAVYVLEGAV